MIDCGCVNLLIEWSTGLSFQNDGLHLSCLKSLNGAVKSKKKIIALFSFVMYMIVCVCVDGSATHKVVFPSKMTR